MFDSPSTLIQFLSILDLFILSALTPGPDILTVIQSSLNRGLKTGLMTVLGIGTGLIFHNIYCVFGIVWLIDKTPILFTIIKMIGGLYIGYLGILSFKNCHVAPIETELCNDSAQQTQSILSRGGFVTGLLVNLLNAKAMFWHVFFYSTIIPERFSLSLRAIFAFCSIASVMIVFSLISVFISVPFVRSMLQKMGFVLNIIIGLAYLFIAGSFLYEFVFELIGK